MAFNVAIRTVCIDRKTGIAEFGVGSGITCDSSSDGEYKECLTKARMLADQQPVFDLFETLRYDDTRVLFAKSSYRSDRSIRAIFWICF